MIADKRKVKIPHPNIAKDATLGWGTRRDGWMATRRIVMPGL
jgi:hypothetical protein